MWLEDSLSWLVPTVADAMLSMMLAGWRLDNNVNVRCRESRWVDNDCRLSSMGYSPIILPSPSTNRQHNNANVLCLPERFISEEKALAIVDAFLNASFEGGRHERRVGKIVTR